MRHPKIYVGYDVFQAIMILNFLFLIHEQKVLFLLYLENAR